MEMKFKKKKKNKKKHKHKLHYPLVVTQTFFTQEKMVPDIRVDFYKESGRKQ
jgi:hypothetical protein